MNTITVVSPESFGDKTVSPNRSYVTDAPGKEQWEAVQNLLSFAQRLETKSRVDMLLKGAVFSELKNLYREYTKALYKAGYRKGEVATYNQFKAESGFSIPSQASISAYTRVYACYVVGYKMARLERDEKELSFSWIEPLLLAAPFEMLVYTLRENYHNTAECAYKILYNLQPEIMKRSDFWLWLERQPRVTAPSPPAHLIDDSRPPDKPYYNSIEEVYESYQLNSVDFWKEIVQKIAIPPEIKRPIRLTISVNEIEYGK